MQHYGWRYDYKARHIDPSMQLGPLPDWADVLAERLVSEGLLSQRPDQVIVNEYIGDQSISAHVDSDSFGDSIATVSLLESWVMIFRKRKANAKVEQRLGRRSVAIMSGEARYGWTHELPKRKSEPGGPGEKRQKRRRRHFAHVSQSQQKSIVVNPASSSVGCRLARANEVIELSAVVVAQGASVQCRHHSNVQLESRTPSSDDRGRRALDQRPRVAQVQQAVGREVGVRENVEQSALPPREHLRHARNRIGQQRPVPHDAQTSGAFGDQHVAVGRPRDGPGDIEAVGPRSPRGNRDRPTAALPGRRSGTKWIIGTALVLAGPLSGQIAGVNARVDDLRVDLTTRIDDLRADLTTQIGSVNAPNRPYRDAPGRARRTAAQRRDRVRQGRPETPHHRAHHPARARAAGRLAASGAQPEDRQWRGAPSCRPARRRPRPGGSSISAAAKACR